MRLLFYSDAVELGGAEQSLATLLGSLSPRVEATLMGVDAAVLEWIAKSRPGTGIEVVSAIRTKRDVMAIRGHLEAVRRIAPDILHANLRWLWSGQYGVAAGVLARGVRSIAVEHAAPVRSPHASQRMLKRRLSLRLDAHVAVGFKSARQVERCVGLPDGSVQTIHNGVALPKGRSRSADPTRGPVIGAVGRITAEKRFADLLGVLERRPEARLVVVGDGPERPALERAAEQLGVRERLLVTGWVADPSAWIRDFDVFALPSLLEAFPLTILEAMLAERAVVATDVGSVSEAVIDGESGVLVRPGDRGALNHAICGLLDDPARRQRLAANGRERARRCFTAQTMAERFEALYDEVLA